MWYIEEPNHPDRYYAERLAAWEMQDNPKGFLRCWMMQREKGAKKKKVHIQGWSVTPEKKGKRWLVKRLVFPNEMVHFKACDGNIKEQVKYMTKTGEDGRMDGHSAYSGM